MFFVNLCSVNPLFILQTLKTMSLSKLLLNDTLQSGTRVNTSCLTKVSNRQLLKIKTAQNRDNSILFNIPKTLKGLNSGILASSYEYSTSNRFTEFILPGDALMQKSY